jgi:hypothetical protein
VPRTLASEGAGLSTMYNTRLQLIMQADPWLCLLHYLTFLMLQIVQIQNMSLDAQNIIGRETVVESVCSTEVPVEETSFYNVWETRVMN